MSLRGTHLARAAALLGSGALAALAGCGGGEATGRLVDAPSDSETSYLDDPCTRANGNRLRRYHITDDGFRPPKAIVRSGTPVAFINCGVEVHRVKKVSGRGSDFESNPIEPKEKYERTFADIGTQRIVDPTTGAEMIIEVTGQPGQPQN